MQTDSRIISLSGLNPALEMPFIRILSPIASLLQAFWAFTPPIINH